ncbi:MAG: DMT family transporter [Proteobacteria bacterium]|nr:DMT family transporter [Pseudomonadota bacterium]
MKKTMKCLHFAPIYWKEKCTLNRMNVHAQNNDTKTLPSALAIGMALLSYILFTAGDTLAKWLQGGYHASQIILTINIVGFIIMAGIALNMRGARHAFKSKKWPLLLVRGAIGATSTLLVFYALKHLPLADFYGIVFMNPIWVALISFFLLKEKIPSSRWIAIFIGFLGVLVIAGSEFKNLNLGYIAAVGVSIFGASAALLARHIGGDEPVTNFGLATHAVMIAVNAPLAIDKFIMPTLPDLGLMVLYGSTTAIAMMFISTVFSRAHSVSQIAPLQYTQMVWGMLFGWLIFHHVPSEKAVMGGILVVSAGLYVMQSLRRGRLMNR